jgi:hypothetical protein
MPRAWANLIEFVLFKEVSIRGWTVSGDILKLPTFECQTNDVRKQFKIVSDL